MKLRLSTEFNQCHSISDHNNNLLACISTNTPGLPEKMVERFNAFEDGGLVELFAGLLDTAKAVDAGNKNQYGDDCHGFHMDLFRQCEIALAKAKEARHA